MIRFFAALAAFELCSPRTQPTKLYMTDDQNKGRQDLSSKAKDAARPAPDDRDATIERLERAVAEERQHGAMLLKTAEELRFKTGILETSYATQLEDARLRSETAERGLADQQAQMAALETAHEEALRLLAEARAELESVSADPGQLRGAPGPADRMPINTISQDDAESRAQEGSLTINKLMRDSSWADEGQPGGHKKKHPETPVLSDQDAPPEELIAPELVFTVEGDDDS